MQLRRREKERKPVMYRLFYFYDCTFVVLISFFEKLTHTGNRSKSDNLFKSEKATRKFCGDHKNKPPVQNEKLVNNSKMNKAENQ